MKIHNWETFNELNKDTYYSAANKLPYNTQRSKDLYDHARKMGIQTKYPFMEGVKFNIYVKEYIDDEGEFTSLEEGEVVEFTMSEYFDRTDHYEMYIAMDTDHEFDPVASALIIQINFDATNNKFIQIFYSNKNKFADRRSFKKFFEILKKCYISDDPNVMRKLRSNINNTKTTEITPEDVEDDTNLWKFFNENGYNWEKFEKEVNTRMLWDNLSHLKKKPMWVSTNTWENKK